MRSIFALATLSLTLAAALPAAAQSPPPPRATAPRPTPQARPAETPAPPPVAEQRRAPTVTFQVVVLLAEAAGNQRPEGLSPRAHKALADVRDFLPYKSYRVVDSAWIRTDEVASTNLSGLEGRTLQVEMRMSPFRGTDEEPIRVNDFNLLTSQEGRDRRLILHTSFGIRPGETIVVGTSKLDGPDKALVVLLSALP